MKKDLLHTPEGVRDIYNQECEQKMALESGMLSMMKAYGYHPIQTPMFEFFDIFGKEIGSTPSKDLYKFFDREGNTLVLRPDITPSIARCASKYYMDETTPLRFCYVGNTFVNNSSLQGRLKEYTQAGAEFIGDGSVDADAEIIALAIQLLKEAGLKEFQLSVGHVGFLEGLFEAAGLSAETEEEIRDRIHNRNFYGVLDIIGSLSLEKNLADLFTLIAKPVVTLAEIRAAQGKALEYPRVLEALKRLEELNTLLEIYGVDRYITYELAMQTELTYYTGMIFAGYTYGTGEAIVKGGRYDGLLTYFGKESPATGFAVVVNRLMSALSRQNISIPVENRTKWILYDEEHRREAVEQAIRLRGAGEEAELMPVRNLSDREKLEERARKNRAAEILYYC